jgi:uncharacterized cupredoxin-like copper-binding protein
MKRAAIAIVLTAATLGGRPASAHHSFGSAYVDKQLSIEGEVLQFVYRNPHALLQVMALDANRQMQRWTVEWEAMGQLDHQGVTSMTLKPGDRVIITGNPGKNGADHWLRAQTIVRPRDGWKWAVGRGSMR